MHSLNIFCNGKRYNHSNNLNSKQESSFIYFRMIEFPHSLFEDFCNKVKSTQVSNLSKLLIIENFKKFSKIKLVSKFFSQVQKLAKKYAQVSEKSSKTTPELNLNKKKRLSIKDLQSELLKYGHEKDQEELKSLQNELYAFIIVEIKYFLLFKLKYTGGPRKYIHFFGYIM